MASRTALFGGTFDPIHNAHLEMARAAADRFASRKVSCSFPPSTLRIKEGAKAGFADRVRMCELACGEDTRFEVSRVEEGSERSYSILTIEKLQANGIEPLSFLIGADAFAEVADLAPMAGCGARRRVHRGHATRRGVPNPGWRARSGVEWSGHAGVVLGDPCRARSRDDGRACAIGSSDLRSTRHDGLYLR